MGMVGLEFRVEWMLEVGEYLLEDAGGEQVSLTRSKLLLYHIYVYILILYILVLLEAPQQEKYGKVGR